MRSALYLFIVLTTCVPPVSAQVVQYEIDPAFNSEQLFFRGSVSDLVHTDNDKYLVMGMFGSTSLSSGLLNTDGSLF